MTRPFGMAFHAATEQEFAVTLANEEGPSGGGPRLVATANVAHIVELRVNDRFRAAYRNAWRVTADGTPVYVYARSRGIQLPERLTGSGLFAKLMPLLKPGRHRCFFVAASDEIGSACKSYLVGRGFAEDAVAFAVPPYRFEADLAYGEALATSIREHATTHLFFGVGAPKSEIWTVEHAATLGDCYVLCIGAGLEFFAGLKTRGPEWMKRTGLEWLWRLIQEPRRLARRYLVSSWTFFAAVADDIRGHPLIG